MVRAEFVEKYALARDAGGLSGHDVGWPAGWSLYRNLASEPIEDLLHAGGDRDELTIDALISDSGTARFVVSLIRTVWFDEGQSVAAEFWWRWPEAPFADVAPFDGSAFGSGQPRMPEGATTVPQLIASFEASPAFAALATAGTPALGRINVL
jgi:hypothetical protein